MSTLCLQTLHTTSGIYPLKLSSLRLCRFIEGSAEDLKCYDILMGENKVHSWLVIGVIDSQNPKLIYFLHTSMVLLV